MGNAASTADDGGPECGLSFELAFDVLRHADVKDSARAACACKALRDMQKTDLWWKRAAHRLGEEARLYVSATAAGNPIAGGTWKDAFFRLWACRDRWQEPAVDEAERVRDRFRRMIDGESRRENVHDEDEAAAEEPPASDGAASPPAAAAAADTEQGSIKVCVRMRPRGANAPRGGPVTSADGDQSEGVVLPLHQRLQIIKAQRGPGCSTGDAMRVLMEDSGRGAEAGESPWASAEVPHHHHQQQQQQQQPLKALDDLTNKGGTGAHATAPSKAGKPSTSTFTTSTTTAEAEAEAERAASASASAQTMKTGDDVVKEAEENAEQDEGTRGDYAAGKQADDEADGSGLDRRDPTAGFAFTCGVLSADEKDGRVLAVAPGVGLREFAFDAVFADHAEQSAVYETSARPLVADFINGFNGAMLVYGQTGSGKTHTMFGPNGVGDSPLGGREEDRGVIPRACEEVLEAAAARAALGVASTVSVSYVEVYGQEMTDLLRGGVPVGQSRVAGQRYVLDGHAEQPVCGLADALRALARGDAQKRRAATAMNERSSRAHAVFTLSLAQRDEATGRELRSRLCLADLGGSEKLSKSRAHDGAAAAGTVPWAEYYSRRQRLTEAVNINTGLLALKRCIDALHEAQRAKREGRPPPHVPYQDSKLTTLLSSALGGDSKTVVLVAAAQEHAHAAETVQSLRFGERCASVETRARVGANALAGMIAALNERIAACEEEVKATERWETVRTVRRDDVEGRDEVVLTSKQVGAEDLRRELERMLDERDFLSGRAAAGSAAAASKAKAGAVRDASPAHVVDVDEM